MKSIHVRDAVDRIPFKPLIIEIDSGKSFRIPHRDFISLSPRGETVVIFDEHHVHIVDVEHISSIALERGKRKAAP